MRKLASASIGIFIYRGRPWLRVSTLDGVLPAVRAMPARTIYFHFSTWKGEEVKCRETSEPAIGLEQLSETPTDGRERVLSSRSLEIIGAISSRFARIMRRTKTT